MHAPAAFAAIPFLAGCAATLLFWAALPTDIPVVAAGGAALALLAASAAAADDDPWVACASILGGCFLAGVSLAWIAAERSYNPPLLAWHDIHGSLEPVTLEGVLREDATAMPYGVSLALDVERVGSAPIAGGVRLSVVGSLAAEASSQWRRGRRVRVPAILRRPSVHRNPGGRDEAAALARRGVCLVGSVKSGALVHRVNDGSRLQEAAAEARAWARARLASAIGPVSERSAAIATAILIGDRHRLPEADERRLQDAGTYHVIAISGGNIAIVTVVLMLLARALLLPRSVSAGLTIAALMFYGQIAGPAPSVERAVTAAVIFLAARLVDHRGPPLNALAVAGILAVAASPVAVVDPGFMLSFGATLAILLGAPLLPRRRDRVRVSPAGPVSVVRRGLPPVRRAALAVLIATVCAELALAPVGASLFGRVTFAGLLLNFFAVPLMTLVQIAGAAVLAVARLWPGLSEWAVRLTHGAATGLVESARLVEIAPWLSTSVRPPCWQLVTVYYAGVLAMLSPPVRRGAAGAAAAAAALMLAGPAALTRDHVSPPRFPLRVVVLDVGQGDATLISMAPNHAVLVDAGGAAAYSSSGDDEGTPGFDVGERVVAPALRALDVSRLDAFVVTHGDPDHVRGAPGVFRAFDVRSVWEGVPVPPHPGLRALRTIATGGGTSWRTVQAGDREQFGDVELRVLHPPPPEWERQRVRNEDSVVLEVRLGVVSVILAGDIGREGERAILSRLEPGRLTVLKAGHHGSGTSSTSELLSALDPAAVIFSAGRDNRFGHPHPAVVARFEARGTAIFRTDRDGAVFVETDGNTLEVRGWTGRALTVGRTSETAAR